jgi:hypothetical protein
LIPEPNSAPKGRTRHEAFPDLSREDPSIGIARKPAAIYAFVANPRNLPKWASGLGISVKKVGRQWLADSPMGKVRLRFAPKNAFGVLDHLVTIESGQTFNNPMRVQANGRGSEVVFTLYRLPGVSDAAFAKDAKTIRHDLATLKSLLEK